MTNLKQKIITSSLPSHLYPTEIWDVKTGEQVTRKSLQTNINLLINHVVEETKTLFTEHETLLLEVLENYKGTPQPAEYARQQNIIIHDNLPKKVKAQSRIGRLVKHKLISETASYVLNPNLNKQSHSFSKTINLGAVDNQMATMSYDNETNQLTLLWKCWEQEYFLVFQLPAYIQTKRNVHKWCLPVVSEKGFKFSYQEKPVTQSVNKPEFFAATDLGRIKIYHTTVVNHKGDLQAVYTPSGKLNMLNRKRENLLKNKQNNWVKIEAYRKLNSDNNNPILVEKTEKLEEHNRFLAGKAHNLLTVISNKTGAELAIKLSKHNITKHYTEQLNWVSGTSKSVKTVNRGSKWGHSQSNNAI